MRIVERAEFLGLPAGTVYKEWRPSSFGGLLIKGETIRDVDWYETDLIQTEVQGEHEDDYPDVPTDGTSFRVQYNDERNGLFSHDQYCVFEREDVLQLVDMLSRVL